jgi:2-polyprenyl-3-methyl-5-hydroxy-6-metoxy-1,4-benzoquinol methylase
MKNLDFVARIEKHEKGFNGTLIQYRMKEVLRWCKGNKVLDLGCGDGQFLVVLNKRFRRIVAVDGSKLRMERAKQRMRNAKSIKFVVSFFEKFEPDEKFDTIIAAGILEHVDNAVLILKRARRWLNKNGVIIITVPNANSLHRHLGVKMKLLKNVTEFNKLDLKVGHKRIYTENLLKEHIRKSNLKLLRVYTYLLKPFANSDMEKLTKEQIEGLYRLCEEKSFQKYGAELVAVCGK